MKKYILLIVGILGSCYGFAQSISPAIDTSDAFVKSKVEFIRSYFNEKQDVQKYWLPKYDSTDQYNFSMLVDGISQRYTPFQMSQKFDIEITELQSLNDSLSYFKFMLSSEIDKHIIEYKYYLVKDMDTYYIDNCKDYEKHKFVHIETPNISFFISPWMDVDSVDLLEASQKLESISKTLKPDTRIPKVESYICSSLEEMNLLTNITHFYGYVGGFTHLDEGFIISHAAPPAYLHEFIHVILGRTGGSSFFLGEGIASYLGGPSHKVTYEDGLRYLDSCFDSGRCTFDLLLARKIYNPRDNIPTYAFAAALCDYIINTYGYDYFLSLYYNPSVKDNNLIEKLCSDHGVTKKSIEEAILSLIKKGKNE